MTWAADIGRRRGEKKERLMSSLQGQMLRKEMNNPGREIRKRSHIPECIFKGELYAANKGGRKEPRQKEQRKNGLKNSERKGKGVRSRRGGSVARIPEKKTYCSPGWDQRRILCPRHGQPNKPAASRAEGPKHVCGLHREKTDALQGDQ